MPRKRKMPETPINQPYGEKQRLDTAMAETEAATPGGMSGSGPVPVPTAPATGAVGPEALMAAQMMEPPGESAWSGPSARPNEPLTTGIVAGPGAGPEVLGPPRRDYVADLFESMAFESGNDPLLHDLARRSRQYPR